MMNEIHPRFIFEHLHTIPPDLVRPPLNPIAGRQCSDYRRRIGAENNGSNVAEDVSLQYAQDQGIGYLG